MSDSVSKFKALYFKKDLIERNIVRVENYFYFLEEKEEFREHPFYEFVKNIKEKGESYMEELIKKGELLFNGEESFYIYEQEFRIYDEKFVRKGFLCALKLKSGKNIFPHEDVFDWAVEVHKNFYEKSGINFEPVLLIYKGKPVGDFIEKEELIFEVKDEFNEFHRIRKCVIDDNFFDEIEKSEFVIADGHHRFKAMLKANFDKRLVLLFSVYDDNLKILPTHRGVNLKEEKIKRLIDKSEKLDVIDIEENIKKLKNPQIIMFHNNNFYFITGDGEDFSVSYLHKEIITEESEPPGFYRDYRELLNDVKKGKFNTAFFLPPLSPLNVYEYAINKLKLPPKSTDFYPKPLCGFIGLKLF